MATTAPPKTPTIPRSASQPLRAPADDTVWTKYSQHGEAPLSFVGSLATHIIVIGLLAVAAYLTILYFSPPPASLPISTIQMPGGGGGDPKGEGDGPGVGIPGEDVDPAGNNKTPINPDLLKRPALDVKEKEAVKVEFSDDPNARQIMEGDNENLKKLMRMNEDARSALREGVNPGVKPGKGEGGTGQGGGKGTGKGKGKGPGEGDRGQLNQREQRMLRWTIIFATRNGQDYLDQLRDLGAIIAIPSMGGDHRKYLTCDLAKFPRGPYKFTEQDMAENKRIFWTDDSPGSVRSLMGALSVNGYPNHFVALLPESVEEEMFKLEHQYKNLDEDEIFETKFKCVRHAKTGKYDLEVVEQKVK